MSGPRVSELRKSVDAQQRDEHALVDAAEELARRAERLEGRVAALGDAVQELVTGAPRPLL